MINQIVNQRYEAVEKLGESSLFSVYKAREKAANRFVALKAVQPAYAKDVPFMDGLQVGTEAASHLNHPNIASVQELGIEGDAPYLVTEFVRGINLKERVRRIAPFTLSVAIDFACGVSEALHYAHSLGLPHGDLRPQNIIISPEGAVKITDFGVQQAIAASPKAQRDVLKFSASYHAPELSTARPGTAGGDIYALGAILYEMLTGTPLYSGATPEDIADQHAFSAIPSPRSINSGVPTSVVGIMLKCLQKKPEERYTTAAELLNDLRSVRDALRFGKSLSWSPVDIEKLSAAPPRPKPPVELPKPKPIIKPKPAPPPPPVALEPVADVAASSQALPMPAHNRIREQDDRVSLYIKIPLLFVTGVIVVCLVIFGGIWSSSWVQPKVIPSPQLIGRSIDDVRADAKNLGVKLIEHHEYNAKPRKIVYKADKELGAQLRKGAFINVWFSDGPQYVDVPKLKGLNRDDAEKKILEAGLTLGKITTKNSETAPQSCVISQSGKVRVLHDTAIDLVVSDGPVVEAGQDTPPAPMTPDPAPTPQATVPDSGPNPGPSPDDAPHEFNRFIMIQNDHRGTRSVRIEYDDTIGTHKPIDEPHAEGDRIPVQFTYYGKSIKMRIFYNDEIKRTLTISAKSPGGEIR